MLLLLVLPAAAQAWKVDVHLHGAGKVTEVTDARLMNSTTGAWNPCGTRPTTARATPG